MLRGGHVVFERRRNLPQEHELGFRMRRVQLLEVGERRPEGVELPSVDAAKVLHEAGRNFCDAIVFGDEPFDALMLAWETRRDEGKDIFLLVREVFEQRLAKGLDSVADLVQLVFELRLTVLDARERLMDSVQQTAELAVIVHELLEGIHVKT